MTVAGFVLGAYPVVLPGPPLLPPFLGPRVRKVGMQEWGGRWARVSAKTQLARTKP